MWQKAVAFYGIYFINVFDVNGHCIDIHSQIVSQGLHYVPGPNSCTLCICDKGGPKWCKSVLCSQPQNCKSFQRGNSCCEFKCLDDILTTNDTYRDTYDLALRLIASSVFIILTLSLLFFVIHRFRRHKVQVRQNRRLGEDQRSLNSIGYITGSLGYLSGSLGYGGNGNNDLEFQYEETNAHYSLWKPRGNYFPHGEAPPPYDEAIRSGRIDSSVIDAHTILTNTSIANEIGVQPHQLRPSQNQPNSIQCRHHHITNRSILNNNNQNHVDVTVETVSTEHIDSLASFEKLVNSNIPSNVQIESYSNYCNISEDKNIKHDNLVFKVKHSANIPNKAIENQTISHTSEPRNTNQRLPSTTDHDIVNSDRIRLKFDQYENMILRNSAFKGSRLKKVDKTQSYPENCYENLNPKNPNTSHKTFQFSDYQNESIFQVQENEEENILVGNKLRRKLNKSSNKFENNLRSLEVLKEYTDIPLHRSLPKNLKAVVEEAVSISSKSNNECKSQEVSVKSGSVRVAHRTLPKHLSNYDALLSINVIKPQINLSGKFYENSLQPNDFGYASSSYVGLIEKKLDEKPKLKDQGFISYQFLSSSQDEDDYRSECENCKSSEMVNVEGEESDILNETMTLQRRPEISEEVPYYRTSLTLPTQIKKPRTVMPNQNRWFSSVQETSSSEDSE